VGKRGAAVLVLPGDILAGDAAGHVHASATVTASPRPAPGPEAVAEMVSRISSAERTMIFGGIGCARARDQVLELAARLNAPIGHTLRGKDGCSTTTLSTSA
jgi:pyruvate dehydrogenase (quinone)